MELRISDKDEEITVPAFERWLATSRPRDRFVYHRGFLAADREEVTLLPQLGKYVHVFHEPMHSLGQIAWHAYERGLVTLVQKKLPNGRGFEYIAFKRSSRR